MACKVALRRFLAAVPTAARDVNGLTPYRQPGSGADQATDETTRFVSGLGDQDCAGPARSAPRPSEQAGPVHYRSGHERAQAWFRRWVETAPRQPRRPGRNAGAVGGQDREKAAAWGEAALAILEPRISPLLWFGPGTGTQPQQC
jgi:hypothetical protein